WRAWPRMFPDPLAQGLDAYARGDWRAASARAIEALDRAPGERRALKLLARSSARLGRDESAQGLYRRLGESAMGAEDYVLLASGVLRQRDDDLALALLQRAVAVEPGDPEAIEALARLLARKDQLEQAMPLA